MADDIAYMDLKEFWDGGFLQEANRQFFHPLGLALEVLVDDAGAVRLGGVWDHRADPEGMIYGGAPNRAKAERVAEEHERHREQRLLLMGDVIQPLGWDPAPSLQKLEPRGVADGPTRASS